MAPVARAGNIFFGMAINGNTLTLTNQGNSTAFYPAVLRILPDGQWAPLPFPPGSTSNAELLPGAKIDFVWEETAPGSQSPLEALRPVMVRFYDQAGSGFGQISFFAQPQMAEESLDAGYHDGRMTITPPKPGSAIHASWLLWPQEGGIGPLHHRLDLTIKQPPARRIVWHPGTGKVQFDLGAGEPFAMLVHETDHGLLLQNLGDGGLQGREQRPGWLDAGRWFYGAAQIAAALALCALLARVVMQWLGQRKKVTP